MSEEGKERGQGRIVEGESDLSAEALLTVTRTVITESSSGGGQTWSVERGEWELKRGTAEHKQQQERERQEHEFAEARKDNDLRRRCFWLIVGLLIAILVVSAAVGIANDDGDTRRWAQNVVTTMIGGLLGSVAGYLTAKGGSRR